MDATDPLSFDAWFRQTFRAEPPFAITVPLFKQPGLSHWASAKVSTLSPSRLVIPTFPDDPEVYTVAGHWGYGIASQAFYFIQRAGERRVFLRLAFGGAYGERGAEAAEVVAALEAYRAVALHPWISASTIT